ncbi:MAG: TonB-dependent receptor [Clostridium sp.]|nr:TonB-dependent receptor [Clostridium sp.]
MTTFLNPTYLRRATALWLWLTTAICVCAQSEGRVKLTGRVVDESQDPVVMATVRVAGQPVGTTTNLDGRYELEFATADTVTIVYSLIGYAKREKKLTKPQGKLTLNITMKPLSLDIGEVTVKEMRRQMNTTQEIDTKQARRMPSTTGNAVEGLVATQAGVSSHNELSSQYNVRGGSFDENSVYINGVEVYRPLLISSGQQEGLSVINSDMVDKVSFSAGGFDAQYGDKMSSVLDITYRKPRKFEASASGSLLGASLYAGFALPKFTMSHGVRYKTNQYMLGSLETKGEYSPRFVDYQTYITWTPGRHWELDFIGNVSQNKYDFIPTDRETNFGTMYDVKSFRVYFDGQEQDLFRTLFGTLKLTRTFGRRTSLSLLGSAFTTKERETYDIQGEYWLSETNTSEQLGVGTYKEHARNFLDANMKSLRLLFNHKPDGHDIRSGITWKNETVKERSREWEMRDSAGYSMPHTPDELRLIFNQKSANRINGNRLELFAQDTWRFTNRQGIFSLNYGARLSYWSWNSEWLFSPRVSLGFVPKSNDNLTFRLATGLYYQSPFYKELRDTTTTSGTSVVTLNRNIKSQRSFQLVLAGDYKFRMMERNFKLTAEVYYKALSRINPYTVDNVKIVYLGENAGTGYTVGLDLKLFGEFVPGTDSWISLSLMKAQQKVNGVSLPQPTDQRYNINCFFSDFFPGTDKWQMTLKACIADGLPFGPPHTALERQVFRAPAYKRVDIGMNYRLLNNEDGHNRRKAARAFRNIWLGVDCFNVFDLNNVSSYYWITDVTNQQYAVPNYLTGRQFNVRFLIEM